jgi:hypothetical protein
MGRSIEDVLETVLGGEWNNGRPGQCESDMRLTIDDAPQLSSLTAAGDPERRNLYPPAWHISPGQHCVLGALASAATR